MNGDVMVGEEFPVLQLPAEGSVPGTSRAELDRLESITQDTQLTCIVAEFLQQHPRKAHSVADVAKGTGLTRQQVAGVLRDFVNQRTDVTRVRRGVYQYHAGRGPGLKPKEEPVIPVAPTGVYKIVDGARTKDGRQVVQRDDGQLFALEEL